MEDYILEKDIKILFVTARSFPEGISEALEKLHALVPPVSNRKFFGVSRPNEKGVIVYKAGTEELYEGEAEKLHCETLIIKKGKYISTMISNYADDLAGIGKAFEKLLAHPSIDPDGYCVEMYLGTKDVRCMVRLKES